MPSSLILFLVIAGIAAINILVWLFLVNRLVKVERALAAVIHTMVEGLPAQEIPEDLAALLTTPRGGAHRGRG
jgi:uncharacterized membrane protein YqiK